MHTHRHTISTRLGKPGPRQTLLGPFCALVVCPSILSLCLDTAPRRTGAGGGWDSGVTGTDKPTGPGALRKA